GRLELPAYATLRRRPLEQSDPDVLDACADLYWILGDRAGEAAARSRLVELEAEHDTPAAARARLRYARLRLLQDGVDEGLALLRDVADTAAAPRGDSPLPDRRFGEGHPPTP